MKRKITLGVVLILVALFVFTACAQTPPPATNEAPASEKADSPSQEGTNNKVDKLGFVHMTSSWTMYQVMEKAVAERAAAAGIEFVTADPNVDANKQAQQIETMINSGVDAIICVVIDGAVLEPVAKKAAEKGVALIPLFTPVEGAPAQILVDEYAYGYAIGEMGAKYMAEKYPNDEIEVGLLRIHDYLPGIERGKGMEAALKDILPKAKVVNDQNSVDVETAMKATEAILSGNPNTRLFLTDSDDTGAIGAYQVLKAKVKPEDFDKYAVIGADGVPQAFEYIKEGGMYRGTVALLNEKIGNQAFDLAMAVANGEEFNQTEYVEFEQVDYDKAKANY